MRNRLLYGGAVAVFGLLIALVPVCIFPTCAKVIETAAGGTVPMKCFWSGRAEIGIGLLILCGGVLLAVFKSTAIRGGISIMTALTGILGLMVPTVLIGGCEMHDMACRMTTFPAVSILSALTAVICAANAIFYLRKRNGKSTGEGKWTANR